LSATVSTLHTFFVVSELIVGISIMVDHFVFLQRVILLDGPLAMKSG
jgi:hypothetical protein